jgi:hypothetical protein
MQRYSPYNLSIGFAKSVTDYESMAEKDKIRLIGLSFVLF